MALCSRSLAVLLLCGWSYLCVGYCAMLKDHLSAKRKVELTHTGDSKDQSLKKDRELLAQDTMTEHMQMLYAKYNRAGFPFKDGNTVRSFKAHWGTINQKQLQIFNLTSLTKSEDVLSATLHYYIGDMRNGTRGCAPRSTGCPARHGPGGHGHVHGHVQMAVWSFALVGNDTRTLGHFRVNVSTVHRDFISWQWRDITRVVNQGKHHDELLIGIEVASRGGTPWKRLLSDRSPYILVYANDSAISEPESVMTSLRRHHAASALVDGSLAPGFHELGLLRARNDTRSSPRRRARAVNALLPLQNNELPGPEYPYESAGWDDARPYDPLGDTKQARRPRKKTRKDQRQKTPLLQFDEQTVKKTRKDQRQKTSRLQFDEQTIRKTRKDQRQKTPLLQFDEQTVRKARKKQWNEPRTCARRYLKVDFADIGWSDWIISPKSFDAFYCSGSCQFPMPKALKPSNHATIQSIVRAVGVVPGIPEPCCVPEKMSPLSILFFDEDKNVVLKVYPNMTVDSCACR